MIQNLLPHKAHGCDNNSIGILRTYGPTNHNPLELISKEHCSQYVGKPLKDSLSMNCLVLFLKITFFCQKSSGSNLGILMLINYYPSFMKFIYHLIIELKPEASIWIFLNF